MSLSELQSKLSEKYASYFSDLALKHQELTAVVSRENLLPFSILLRDDVAFDFKCLVDVSGIDYLTYGQGEWKTNAATATGFSRGVDEGATFSSDGLFPARFSVAYHLLSLTHRVRLRLKVFVPEEQGVPPSVDSVVKVWPSANWHEREVFDMFGIFFKGHPDLRRILTDYGFIGHPFRKDFPLVGIGEVRYDAGQQKVIYEPVTVVPRVLVPRVVRRSERQSGRN